ncbi:MAG TPA: hypothetical protein VIS29_07410 [Streptomyces sp.]
MPTDYACQNAADIAADAFNPLAHGPADGAAGLLAFLDGLHAELNGTLTGWHSTVGNRIRGVLGLPAPGAKGPAPTGYPTGWEALGLVQHRAQEVLTTLSSRPRGDSTGPAGLTRRLDLVRDAFAGVLRALGIGAEESVYCAAELAAAAGLLFGVRPRHRAESPSPAPAPAQPATNPIVALPRLGDWTMGGGMP